ncbi:DUF262 domain-containing protein [Pseudonocardia alni subsp. carboxydivorans]|uniref:DUF262 domain-containing protein n=1 Tax=Pseudonocardia alni subsp. carboxydivorans TaxID=415010 RepID=A0ABU9ADA0_PSEA5
MHEILGKARTVREMLDGARYAIDYYQREYRWEAKQIQELLDDLTGTFLQEFDPGHDRSAVARYPHYFLGSVIISRRDDTRYIVDGQQRLTSLTLLLVLLHRLQSGRDDRVPVESLVCSTRYGRRSMNLDIDDRNPCMEALLEGRDYDVAERSDSVRNLVARYEDLETMFPEEIRGGGLPYFADWLLDKVHLVEITAFSDEDAYTIFETMNDRGLQLTPTDMLRGYLLARIDDPSRRSVAADLWRTRVRDLNDAGKEVEPDFFKTWLRSQYATRTRARTKGATAEDFERIGTQFHRWIREAQDRIGLKRADDVFEFVNRDFDFYSRWYLATLDAAATLRSGLERIHYTAQLGFTLQHLLLMAPLDPGDDDSVVRTKLDIVSRFVDILVTRRIWNFRSIAYSTQLYATFVTMRDSRRLPPGDLADYLHERLTAEAETFDSNDGLRIHQQNRYLLHRVLARLTDHVETESGNASRYAEYVAGGQGRYEVEHIWANHPERHREEFPQAADFAMMRDRFGGLLLLPKRFNGSYGDLPYEEKVPHYLSQNLLARSLHPQCYERNPGFLDFIRRSGLPFHAHDSFRSTDLVERYELYRELAKRIWNPDDVRRAGGRTIER